MEATVSAVLSGCMTRNDGTHHVFCVLTGYIGIAMADQAA